MPATTNKQQLLTFTQTALKKKFPVPPEPEKRSVLEEVLYAIVREGVPSAEADTAFIALKAAFFDWNEVRVSSVQEVADTLGRLPGASAKAERLVGFLQEVFEERYSFDLSDVAKKGLKQGGKQLARYKGGVTDFVVAWVTQRSFGGHAVPLDGPSLRVLRRLGVIDEDAEDPEDVRASVEHYVPKAKGYEFTEQLILHATTICVEKPKCPVCPLKSECPTGQELLSKSKDKPKPKSR
jgi:endonuclease-3